MAQVGSNLIENASTIVAQEQPFRVIPSGSAARDAAGLFARISSPRDQVRPSHHHLGHWLRFGTRTSLPGNPQRYVL